jgi:hypothetical protein
MAASYRLRPPVQFDSNLHHVPTIVKLLLGHIGEIDTSLARRTNNLGSTHGPRVDSGGLPDSSKGEEDFAARRRKEHAKPVGSPTEFLREGRAHR